MILSPFLLLGSLGMRSGADLLKHPRKGFDTHEEADI
jgi:hypothetical protein